MQLSFVPHILIILADRHGRAIGDRPERGVTARDVVSCRRIHEAVAPRSTCRKRTPKWRVALSKIERGGGTSKIRLERVRKPIRKEYDYLDYGFQRRRDGCVDLVESNHQAALGECSAAVVLGAGRLGRNVVLKWLLHRNGQLCFRCEGTHGCFIGGVVEMTDEAGYCTGQRLAAPAAAP